MPEIPGFQARVTRNGSDIKFSRIGIRRSSENVAVVWEVLLPQPVEVSLTDTWSISYGIGGYYGTVVNEATASGLSATTGQSLTRVVRGRSAEAGDILDLCLPITLCFVSSDWLDSENPYWSLEDGMIVTKLPGMTSGIRYNHERLPDKSMVAGTFECLPGTWTHRQIAKWLTDRIGYDLQVNVPDIELQSTHTIPSGTRIFDAITQNFRIWFPEIEITADDAGSKTIWIYDVVGDNTALPVIQKMRLENKAILDARATYRDTADQIVDHVIVTGQKTPYFHAWSMPLSLQTFTLDDATPTANVSLNYTAKTVDVDDLRQFSDYTGEWGEGDEAFTPEKPEQVESYLAYHRDLLTGEMTLIQEIVATYDDTSTLLHRKTTDYRYSEDKRPIGHSEKHEHLVQLPGNDTKVLATTMWHHVHQNRWIPDLDIALTTETKEQLILYDDAGGGVKNNPVPLLEVARADKSRSYVEKDDGTSQSTLEMTTNYRWQTVSREDNNMLLQRIFDYDVLSGVLNVTPQIIENPDKDASTKETKQFRREFFVAGSGEYIGGYGPCYYPPVTIHHDDITTDELARALAERAINRRSQARIEVALSTPVPIPLRTLATQIEIPDIDYEANGVLTTVPGGDYVVKDISERIQYDANGKINYVMDLSLRSVF